MTYELTFAASVAGQLDFLTAAERRRVLAAIERRLTRDPLVETRNRKPLRPNPLAPWELRVGSLRVFYEVDALEPNLVNVLTIGNKRGNKLFVSRKEIQT